MRISIKSNTPRRQSGGKGYRDWEHVPDTTTRFAKHLSPLYLSPPYKTKEKKRNPPRHSHTPHTHTHTLHQPNYLHLSLSLFDLFSLSSCPCPWLQPFVSFLYARFLSGSLSLSLSLNLSSLIKDTLFYFWEIKTHRDEMSLSITL